MKSRQHVQPIFSLGPLNCRFCLSFTFRLVVSLFGSYEMTHLLPYQVAAALQAVLLITALERFWPAGVPVSFLFDGPPPPNSAPFLILPQPGWGKAFRRATCLPSGEDTQSLNLS